MYMTVKGLVIRVSPYKDYDAILTILTESEGKISAKARGLRRKNSPLAAPCQLLAFGEFTLFQYKGMNTINEAQALELFQGLRRNLEKLTLGTYFAQASEIICQEDLPNPELLALVLNCLYGLSKLQLADTFVKAAFEMRAACIAGYMPDLSGCHLCGAAYPDRFDINQGWLECSGCRHNGTGGIRMPLTAGVLDAMRYLCSCDSRQLFSFIISKESELQLSSITESYLTTQLERGFSCLDFYKSLVFSQSDF